MMVNRMARTRVTRRSLVPLTSLPLLAACGVGASPQAPAPRAGDLAAELEFMHRWGGVRIPLMDAQIADFNAQWPKIKVNAIDATKSGETLYDGMPYDNIITRVAAGDPPDVIMIDVRTTPDFASRNALLAVDALLKRDKIGLQETFYPSSVDLAQFGGKTVALPQVVTGAYHILWMNTDVWAQSGLDVKKPPKTWDELLDASQRLTRRDGAGGFSQIAGGMPSVFKAWATANTVQWISADRKKILFNTQESVDALEYMLNSVNQLYGTYEAMVAFSADMQLTGASGAQVRGNDAAFYQGKSGIVIGGADRPFIHKQNAPQLNFAGAMMPFNGRNPKARSTNISDIGWNYAILAGSKKADAAWEWLKYISAGEGNAKFFKAQGRPSVVRKFNETPDLKALPYWDVVLKTLEAASPMPMSVAWRKIDVLLATLGMDVVTRKKAPKPALDEVARLAQDELDQVAR